MTLSPVSTEVVGLAVVEVAADPHGHPGLVLGLLEDGHGPASAWMVTERRAP